MEAARIPWRPLGRVLVEQGLLSEDELERALEEQALTGRRLGETLVDVRLRLPLAVAVLGLHLSVLGQRNDVHTSVPFGVSRDAQAEHEPAFHDLGLRIRFAEFPFIEPETPQGYLQLVDFLKMDIEGAEEKVLRNLLETDKLPLVKEMVLEYHHHLTPDEDRLGTFLEMLERSKFGYQLKAPLAAPFPRGEFQGMLIYGYRRELAGNNGTSVHDFQKTPQLPV